MVKHKKNYSSKGALHFKDISFLRSRFRDATQCDLLSLDMSQAPAVPIVVILYQIKPFNNLQ